MPSARTIVGRSPSFFPALEGDLRTIVGRSPSSAGKNDAECERAPVWSMARHAIAFRHGQRVDLDLVDHSSLAVACMHTRTWSNVAVDAVNELQCGLSKPCQCAKADRPGYERRMSRARFVIVLGGPAAGKGTQAEMLSKALGIPHISTGELLRERASDDAQAVMQRGDLLPDDVVTEMLIARLQQPDAEHGAVLDGFPRTLRQARTLAQWIKPNTRAAATPAYL